MKRRVSRRRGPGPLARLRRFWILLSLGVVVAAAAFVAVLTWPGLRPRAIEVRGNALVSRAAIVAAARVAPDENVWLQNTAAMVARIETIPDVERAWVHRFPPATLTIVVRERTPFARVRSAGHQAVVDAGLRVLQPVPPAANLPLFVLAGRVVLTPGTTLVDPAARRMLRDYTALLGESVRPRMLALDRFGGLVATLPSGIKLLLGDDDAFARKLALIEPVLDQAAHPRRAVQAIDLRAPDTPVVVYKPNARPPR